MDHLSRLRLESVRFVTPVVTPVFCLFVFLFLCLHL